MDLSVISKKFTTDTLDEIVQAKGGLRHTDWKWNSTDCFKKGDSMLSESYRLIIDGVMKSTENDVEEKPIKIYAFVKALPKNMGRRKTFRSTDFFRNECNFYNIVMKKYNDFQMKRLKNYAFTDIPACLKAYCDGEHDYIVLEDLAVDGYGSAPRQNGLDVEHCKIVMDILGKYHALSLAIKDQEPEEFERLVNAIEEVYYAKKYKKWYEPVIADQLFVATDAMEREYPGTIYESKMRSFTEHNLYEKMVELTHTNGRYSVIGHGDCWQPNFLLKYHATNESVPANFEKIPIGGKMIDFQLVRYASAALDISFFIYSCTTQELRDKHYYELLEHYHTSVKDFLCDLGSNPHKVFPYTSLLDEMKAFGCFGVGMAIESLPFSMMEDSEAPDLEEIKGDEAVPLSTVWIFKPIKTKEGRLRIADTFKHAIDQGYLD